MAENTITKEQMVDPRQKFSPTIVAAARALAKSKPWQGDFDKRLKGFQTFVATIQADSSLEGWKLIHEGPRTGDSGGSGANPRTNTLVMRGRLSVVSLFFTVALVRFDGDGLRALRWAITLFAKRFPISFGRCEMIGGLLVNPGRRED